MTLQAHLCIGSVFDITRFKTAGMRTLQVSTSAVALDADITLGVACLAGLQVPACFGGMLAECKGVFIGATRDRKTGNGGIAPVAKHEVRFYPHLACGETAVARVAECSGVMTTIALLWVVCRLDRVDGDKIAAMALGREITLGGVLRKIIAGTCALVAIKTPLLLMALVAVAAGLAGQNPVTSYEIRIMIDCNAFRLMTGVAFPDGRVFIFDMGSLLFGIGLLLEAD